MSDKAPQELEQDTTTEQSETQQSTGEAAAEGAAPETDQAPATIPDQDEPEAEG
jgi:hypothetical protein